MKDSFTLTASLLDSWGRILLLATFAASLIQAMRGEKDLTECFERLALATVFFVFYMTWANELNHLSTELSIQIKKYNDQDSLKALVLRGLDKASQVSYSNGSKGFNVPALIEQVWRTGVWGVMNSIVEFTFVLVDLLIECARETLWKLSLILFPLACGVFPVFPRIMTNMALYLVELALWAPLLCIVRTTTGSVAQVYLDQNGSLGLYVVGVELVAIILMLAVPSITHRLMNGVFSGDLNTHASLIGMTRKAIAAAQGVVR